MWKTTRKLTMLLFQSALVVVALMSLTTSTAGAAPNSPHQGPTLGGTIATPVVDHFKGIVATKSNLSEAARRKELLQAMEAIEDRGVAYNSVDCVRRERRCDKYKDRPNRKWVYQRCMRYVKSCQRGVRKWQKRRERIVTAALKAEKATGVDATLLIALGRMESDFRELELIDRRCGKKKFGIRFACGADCGITQHRLYGSARYVRKMCKVYAKNYNKVFLESAREIAKHIDFCRNQIGKKRHHPIRRCVLNRYNQGPFYKTRSRCHGIYKCWHIKRAAFPTKKMWYSVYAPCQRSVKKCQYIASYWTKLSCFEYGARNKVRSIRSCRRCFYYKDIHKFYPPSSLVKKPRKPTQVSSR